MASLALAFDILARDRASRPFLDVGDAIESTARKGEGAGPRIASGLAFAGRVALGIVGGLATVGAAGGTMGLQVAAGNEQAEIAFTTMLGSAKKAGAFLKDLQAFAAKTPFEFPELQSAASSLISAGIEADKVIPIMTTLGDVTSGMGTGSEGVQRATIALQQMAAAGRITGEDLNQLRDAGIPVYDLLAKATGKSKEEVVKLAQAGKLGKKELGQMMTALETGKGLERFTGLMEKQSASLGGMWSTFMDTLGQGLSNAITPLIPMIKDGLAGASEFLGKALAGVAEVLPRLINGFITVKDWVMNVAGAFGDGGGLRSALQPVVDFIRTEVVPRFMEISTAIRGFVAVALPVVQGFVAGMMTRIQPLMPQIREIFGTIGSIITGVMDLISAVITRATAVIGWVWTNWGQGIMNIVTAVWGALIGVIGPALDIIKNIIKTVTSIIKGDWSGAWTAIQGILSGAMRLISGVVSAGFKVLWSIIGGTLSKIGGFFATTWNNIHTAVAGAIGRVQTAVGKGIATVITTIAGLPGKAVAALANIGSSLISAGGNLIGGFLQGIKNRAGEIVDVIKRWITDKIPDFIKDALGIHSPSIVMMRLGEQTAAGMAIGITSGAKQIQSAAEGMIPKVGAGPSLDTVAGSGSRLFSDADLAAIIAAAVERGARIGTAAGFGYQAAEVSMGARR